MAYTILLVDDSITVRQVIARALDIASVPLNEIHHAGNGKEALEILNNHWIDLAFVDINMPVMNGMELIEQMRKDGVLAKMPVVVISTDGSTTRVEQLVAKGVSAYIRKPFTPEKLRAVVEDVLASREGDGHG
ncbi:MAG: response regulator [Chitinivibrionales bacterium]|nr:response regulator [Chitinivibrionales bacterium]